MRINVITVEMIDKYLELSSTIGAISETFSPVAQVFRKSKSVENVRRTKKENETRRPMIVVCALRKFINAEARKKDIKPLNG